MRRVSGKEMCRALERAGYTLRRVSGSHHIYKRPDNPLDISVPVHRNQTLRKGTQVQIMKDAGLAEVDL
jgi:predicted RNA binding protein YcfA (HicA-like mRNA interferase family)